MTKATREDMALLFRILERQKKQHRQSVLYFFEIN
jgi:hypothetical protein